MVKQESTARSDSLMMILGETKATLVAISERLKHVEESLLERMDRLEVRVTELEARNQKLQGVFAVLLFVCTFVAPVFLKKIGLN